LTDTIFVRPREEREASLATGNNEFDPALCRLGLVGDDQLLGAGGEFGRIKEFGAGSGGVAGEKKVALCGKGELNGDVEV
jgi:hypothetical protein